VSQARQQRLFGCQRFRVWLKPKNPIDVNNLAGCVVDGVLSYQHVAHVHAIASDASSDTSEDDEFRPEAQDHLRGEDRGRRRPHLVRRRGHDPQHLPARQRHLGLLVRVRVRRILRQRLPLDPPDAPYLGEFWVLERTDQNDVGGGLIHCNSLIRTITACRRGRCRLRHVHLIDTIFPDEHILHDDLKCSHKSPIPRFQRE
jgi:hypothetical protein